MSNLCAQVEVEDVAELEDAEQVKETLKQCPEVQYHMQVEGNSLDDAKNIVQKLKDKIRMFGARAVGYVDPEKRLKTNRMQEQVKVQAQAEAVL